MSLYNIIIDFTSHLDDVKIYKAKNLKGQEPVYSNDVAEVSVESRKKKEKRYFVNDNLPLFIILPLLVY